MHNSRSAAVQVERTSEVESADSASWLQAEWLQESFLSLSSAQSESRKREPSSLEIDASQTKSLYSSVVRKSELEATSTKKELPDSDNKSVIQQEIRLMQLAERFNLSQSEMSMFLSDIHGFERRARARGISDSEIADTLSATCKLLEATDSLIPSDQRINIAMQMMRHANSPEDIDQGNHNTCNVATLEEKLFTSYPARAAEIIVSAAIEGCWTSPEGKKIELDKASLAPGFEERIRHTRDGKRSHASQLFTLVAVNDISQRRSEPEFYRQLPQNSKYDTGERRYTADGVVIKAANGAYDKTGITLNELQEEGFRLTGEQKFVVVRSDVSSGNSLMTVDSVGDLDMVFQSLKTARQFPVVLLVEANHPDLFSETGDNDGTSNGGLEGKGRWHVVSVTDFNPSNGMVKISNQWGRRNDYWIHIKALYGVMKNYPDTN